MVSFFRRKKRKISQVKDPRLGSEKLAAEGGFSFEILGDNAVNDCINAMMKATPQAMWGGEELSQWLQAPNSLTLIAKREGTIVGVINGIVRNSPMPPPTIRFMAVLDQKSGDQGLGGLLITKFIDELRRITPKAPYVEVSLPSSERTSIALFSLMSFDVSGFVKDGFRLSFSGGERQDLVMLRRTLTTEQSS
jgi:hypothetical protein